MLNNKTNTMKRVNNIIEACSTLTKSALGQMGVFAMAIDRTGVDSIINRMSYDNLLNGERLINLVRRISKRYNGVRHKDRIDDYIIHNLATGDNEEPILSKWRPLELAGELTNYVYIYKEFKRIFENEILPLLCDGFNIKECDIELRLFNVTPGLNGAVSSYAHEHGRAIDISWDGYDPIEVKSFLSTVLEDLPENISFLVHSSYLDISIPLGKACYTDKRVYSPKTAGFYNRQACVSPFSSQISKLIRGVSHFLNPLQR